MAIYRYFKEFAEFCTGGEEKLVMWEALTLVAHFHSETLATAAVASFRDYECRLNNLCAYYGGA